MENKDLQERVSSLEKRLDDQNSEIVYLRSTLFDAMRRITSMEILKEPTPRRGMANERSPRNLNLVSQNSITVSPELSSDRFKRQGVIHTPINPQHSIRNSTLNYSNSSLASEYLSSSSVSPAPSPSPTQYRQQHGLKDSNFLVQFSSLVSENGYKRSKPSSVKLSTSSGLQTSKRWSSTSDFTPTSIQTSRKFDSNLNISSIKKSGSMQRLGNGDVVYNSEEGIVKLAIRGRNVTIYVPAMVNEHYSFSSPSSPLPKWKLKMEWVYGYRGKDCRSNLFVLPTGEIVYFIATIVVLYNIEEHGQRFYFGHTGDVKCLAVHPNKLLIASGQTAGRDIREGPHVRVWNSVNLQTLFLVGLGEFDKTISCVAFSKADGGNILLIIDDAPDQNLSLWDWQRGEKGIKITETRCSSDLVLTAEWNPFPKENFSFVTCGKGHMYFWSLDNTTLARKLGIFDSRDKPKYITCLTFAENGDLVSGDSNGNILVWIRGLNAVTKIIRNAHAGAVFSLLTLKDGRIVSGGGKDGQLVLWDFPSYRRTGYVSEIPEQYGYVRTIIQGKGTRIVVGTTKNCILQGSFDTPFTPLLTGHSEDLWALCVHPNQSQFASGGYDGRIQLWDTISRSPVWYKDIEIPIQSACFSPDGQVLVLATTCGKWFAMDSQTRDIYATHLDGTESLQVVKFSPNGKFFVIGSRDGNIYVYQVFDTYRSYKRVGRCVGHSNPIVHIDWACDSVHLQSNSADSELIYWNAEVCRQVTQVSSVKDLEWSSATCTLSFPTLRIWTEAIDGTDINSCCASNSRKLIVVGDSLGRLKIFSYPSQPKALYNDHSGHRNVACVRFLFDDTRVLSIGGRDSSVIQWTVEKVT